MESHPGWPGNLPSDTPFGSSEILRDADPLRWQTTLRAVRPFSGTFSKSKVLSLSTRWLIARHEPTPPQSTAKKVPTLFGVGSMPLLATYVTILFKNNRNYLLI